MTRRPRRLTNLPRPALAAAGAMAFMALALLAPTVAHALPPNAPFPPPTVPAGSPDSALYQGLGYTFWANTQAWWIGGAGLARHIFITLAVIEFTWYSIRAVLRRMDLADYFGSFFFKFMALMFFWTLIVYAGEWIPAIVNTFKTAAGVVQCADQLAVANCQSDFMANFDPVTMLKHGVELAGQVMQAAGLRLFTSTITLSPSGMVFALMAVLSALVVLIAFFVGAAQLLVVQIEAYIVCSAGLIMLGFGASQFTLAFTQRYLGYVVTVGFKFFLLALLVAGLGTNLAAYWAAHFQDIMQFSLPNSGTLADIALGPKAYAWDMPSIEAEIQTSAARWGVDPAIIRAVINQESGGQQNQANGQALLSDAGAIGIMQLEPATAAALGVDPYDEAQNIDGGTHYLKEQLVAFNGDLGKALEAYNGGPGCANDPTGNCTGVIDYARSILAALGAALGTVTGVVNYRGLLTFMASMGIFLFIAFAAPAVAGAIMTGAPSLGFAQLANFASGVASGAWAQSVSSMQYAHQIEGYRREIGATRAQLAGGGVPAANRPAGALSLTGAGGAGAGAGGGLRAAGAGLTVGAVAGVVGAAAGAAFEGVKAVGASASGASTTVQGGQDQADIGSTHGSFAGSESVRSAEARAGIGSSRDVARRLSAARASTVVAAPPKSARVSTSPSTQHAAIAPAAVASSDTEAEPPDLSRLEGKLAELEHKKKAAQLAYLATLQVPSHPPHADGHTIHLPLQHGE